MRYFLSFLFLSIIVLLFSPKPSYASETRVLSMGGTEYYMHDNTNIFLFPGSFYTYRNQVLAELRTEKDDRYYSIGINLPAGSNGSFGVYLNRPLAILLPDNISSFISNVELDHATSLFYGNKMANVNWGLGLTFGIDKYTSEQGAEQVNESAHYYGISGGISNDQYDVGLTLNLPSYNWEYENESYSYSGFGINFNTRYFTNKKGEIQFVPLGVFQYMGMSETYDSGISGVEKDVTDYTLTQFAFGVGINYQINPKNLFVMGVEGVGVTNYKVSVKNGDEKSINILTIPGIYVGVESNITSWLIGRFGGAYVSQGATITYKTQSGKETSSSTYASQFKMTFGFGIKFNSFLLDASLNEGLLFEGPNIISGSNQPLSNRLSITYQF